MRKLTTLQPKGTSALAHTLHSARLNQFDREIEEAHALLLNEPVHGPADSIDWADVLAVIGNSRTKKAPGADGVTNLLLKKLPIDAIKWLTKLFNSCVLSCHWPTPYKTAIVIPIKKSGKPANKSDSYLFQILVIALSS